MRIFKILLFISIISTACFAADIKSGEDLVAAMYKKYEGKWYKTLTFEQKTITHKADGTTTAETWYEALDAPGKLRIDQTPLETHNGIIFANGKVYSYRDGKLAGSRDFIHPLLLLGFDIYMQPVATSLSQFKTSNLGIDMSVLHEEKWNGADVYVVGAKPGDLTTPQFWVDKKTMLFVRLFQKAGRDGKSVAETQFNKYVKSGGGWVAAEVKFFTDGKPTTTEEYTKIQSGMKLDENLWNPDQWFTVERNYWLKK